MNLITHFLTKVFSDKSRIFHLTAFLLATGLLYVGILTHFIDEVRGTWNDYSVIKSLAYYY